MHFFVPAPVMKMVEVIRTVVTSPEVIRDTAALCERLGKVSVTINDRAGFIANGLLCGYLNRAVAMYESGYVSREDLDAAMTLGAGLPMGPLALIDLIGVDVALEILNTIYHSGGRDRGTRLRRSSNRWSRPGCSAARLAGAFTPTSRRLRRWWCPTN